MPVSCSRSQLPALKIISYTLLPDRSTTYFRSALISYRVLYKSELRLIKATDAILVLALLILRKILAISLLKPVVTLVLIKLIIHSMHGLAH